MKKTWITILALSATLGAFAQGQVNFDTHITSDIPPVDARILFPTPGGNSIPATAGFGQLVIISGVNVVPLSPIGAFGMSPSEAGYIEAGVATAPAGFPGGTTVNMVFRAWLGDPGSTYATADWKAVSIPITITLTESPNKPNDLIGLQSVTLVPEPTTLALGALGVGAMLLLRRK